MNKQEQRKLIELETEKFLKDHKIKQLKPVKRIITSKKPYTNKLNPCPECGSKLIVDVTGVIICSQDKLKEWYNKCLAYENGNEDTKIQILKEDTHNQFTHLYDRWKSKDANGNRTSFICIYSNRLHSPVPSYNFWIYEVFQVEKLERILKRKLTQAELDGIVKVKYKNKKGNWVEESIERLRFPWDLL